MPQTISSWPRNPRETPTESPDPGRSFKRQGTSEGVSRRMSSHVAATRRRDSKRLNMQEAQAACSGDKRQGSAFRPKSKPSPSSQTELTPTKRESTRTGLSFRSRYDEQRARPQRCGSPAPFCPRFPERLSFHRALRRPAGSNASVGFPYRLAHPPRQPDSPRPPKRRLWRKTTDALGSRKLWKYQKYRLTSRPISYIMLT